MFENLLKNFGFQCSRSEQEFFDQKLAELYKIYPSGRDAWGLNLKMARKYLELIWPVYKNYFKVRLFGGENVVSEPYMVVANHSGQIAIDGLLIGTAFSFELERPRLLRPMVERFFTGLPFLGNWAAECGAVLGERQNCIKLLQKGNSVLVFPEGVSGVAKSTNEFYELQSFTSGFYRLALKTNTKILPVAVVGAEEFFPYVYQAKSLAKSLGLPALPLSANYFPLPSPVDIYIGEPITPSAELTSDAPDGKIDEEVYKVEGIIRDMIETGLHKRRAFWANQK